MEVLSEKMPAAAMVGRLCLAALVVSASGGRVGIKLGSNLATRKGKCVVNGPESSGLSVSFGFTMADDSIKGCVANCKRVPFTGRDSASNGLLDFEKRYFLAMFKEEKELWDDTTKRCKCTLKDGRQALPSFRIKRMCTPRDCWGFYKQVVLRPNTEVVFLSGSHGWHLDPSCEPCDVKGKGPCDQVQLSKVISDREAGRLKVLVEGGRASKTEQDMYTSIVQTFGSSLKVPQCEWRVPKHYVCEPACNDRSPHFKSVVATPKECFCDNEKVAASECEGIPDFEQLCPETVPMCFEWAVVCRDHTGAVVTDGSCPVPKPTLG